MFSFGLSRLAGGGGSLRESREARESRRKLQPERLQPFLASKHAHAEAAAPSPDLLPLSPSPGIIDRLQEEIDEVLELYALLDPGKDSLPAPDTMPKSKRSILGRKTGLTFPKDMKDEILFGAKSKLGQVDLHVPNPPAGLSYPTFSQAQAFFKNQAAWDKLNQAQQADLQKLLPASLHLTKDGGPPADFVAHDINWRNGTRQFADDLRGGLYDAQWQAEAGQAMRERSAGKFDAFKEREFEEYWGQKQQMSARHTVAGPSSWGFEELIKAKAFAVGDTWCYTRTFGSGKRAFVLEKHVKIVAIKAKEMTFHIPPEQLKQLTDRKGSAPSVKTPTRAAIKRKPLYNDLHNIGAPPTKRFVRVGSHESGSAVESTSLAPNDAKTAQGEATSQQPSGQVSPARLESSEQVVESTVSTSPANPFSPGELEPYLSVEPKAEKDLPPRSSLLPLPSHEASQQGTLKLAIGNTVANDKPAAMAHDPAAPSSPLSELSSESMELIMGNNLADLYEKVAYDKRTPTRSGPARRSPRQRVSVPKNAVAAAATAGTVCSFRSPQALERKIVQVDGRVKHFESRGNEWKVFRCRREGKDMGTIHEMRDKCYLASHPAIALDTE